MVTALRIAVDPSSELAARAASALLSHPDVAEVGLVGKKPPRSWGDRATRIDSTAGFPVVVGGMAGPDQILIVAGDSDRPAITFAGPVGLARCLAARLPAPATLLARAYPGTPLRGGRRVAFPAPIGWAQGRTGANGLVECPVGIDVAAVMASDGHTTEAVIDAPLFLAAACLAAGALIAEKVDGPTPVWTNAGAYIEACESLGIVVAEMISER